MEIKKLSFRDAPNPRAIRRLYATAFPKEEQMPWPLVRLLILQRDVDVYGYYEGERFCGFTFSAATEDVLFILFLAVADDCRGQGYGSAILQLLKEEKPGRSIVLNVELLDPAAENYAQRLSRMAFYKKNGFYDTQYDIDEVGGTFRVLATQPRLDVPAYLQVFHKMSFGLWKPYIRRGENYDQRTGS